MFRRHRSAVVAALLCGALVAPTVAAQTPQQGLAPERQVFNDVFIGNPAPAAFLVLSEGVVYRLEVQPAANTSVSLRVARRPGMPPLFLVPLSDGGEAAATASYLVVPRTSGEYRLDVATVGEEPVRVRIVSDPRENQRWAQIRREGFRLPVLGAAVRFGYLASFRDARSSASDSMYGVHTAPSAATGVEACLRVVPSGRVLPARVGGCAVKLGLWRRPADRDFIAVGIAPEVTFARAGALALAVAPEMALGRTISGRPRASYVFAALGVRLSGRIGRGPLAWETGASAVMIRSLPTAPNPRRVTSLTPRLTAGILLNP